MTHARSRPAYGPAWLIAGLTLAFLIIQYRWLPPTEQIDFSGLVTESIISLIPLVGLFVVQHLRPQPRVYWPLMVGLSSLLLSLVTDALDEVRVQPELVGILCEDGLSILGYAFLVWGLARWLGYNRQIQGEIQALNAGLEQRIAERTASLAAEMAERQRAEEVLRLSEARLRLATDGADLGIWYWDLASQTHDWSERCKRHLGLPPDQEPSLEHVYAAIHSDDRDGVKARGQRLLEQDGDPRSEFRVFWVDGSLHWISAPGRVYRHPDGRPQAMGGITQDITQRKLAERNLMESEHRFRDLFEQLPIAYQSLDGAGHWQDANQKMADLLGFATPEDMIGLDFGDYWDEATHDQFPATFSALQATGMAQGELSLRRRDGSPVTVILTGRIQHDLEGNFSRTHCILTDISERRAMEEAIRDLNATLERKVAERTAALEAAHTELKQALERVTQSEERFRLVADHALDNIWTMGPDYRLRYISPSIQSLVGYSMEEYLGLTLDRMLMPASLVVARDYFTRLDERYAAGRPIVDFPFRGEMELRTKDGAGIWTEIIITPLVDAEGRLLELAGVTRDIRERKVFEAQLHRAREAAETANRALQSANGELQRLATTDRLTGTWNRAYFDEVAAKETARAARYGAPLSLLLFDIDHFKAINDSHGHLVGDQVLIELTRRVGNQLRTIDVLIRWGGEEFVVMLPHCGVAEAARVAEKLRALVEDPPFAQVGQVTSSCGVADFRPTDNLDTWLKRADEALYAAKAGGRNRVCVAPACGIPAMGRPDRPADGSPERGVGITPDLRACPGDARRLPASEETARRQLAEIQTYYDTAPVGLAVLDTELRYLRLNQRLAEMNGQPVAVHLGRTVREMVPDLAEGIERALKKVLSTGKPLRNQEIHGKPDGAAGRGRTHLEHYYPLLDERGGVTGLNVVVEDITARRAMDAEIRALNANLEHTVEQRTRALAATAAALCENEERFRRLFEDSPQPSVILEEGRYIAANQAALRMLKVPALEQLLGRSPVEFSTPLQPDGTPSADKAAAMIRLAEERGSYSFEWRNIDAHGQPFFTATILIPIRQGGKALLHAISLDITEQKATQTRIEYLAYHDELTGLPNRRGFIERLGQATAAAGQTEPLVAVCYLNLDDFKPINDSYGHELGDALLRALAARLQDCVRAPDALARVGGDEFGLLLTGMDSPFSVLEAVQWLLKQVNQPLEVQGHRLHLSASLGLTLFPTDSAGPDALLQHAHEALFRAKGRNKGGYHLYDPIQDYEERQRRQWRQDFAHALEAGHLRLHYQPKVALGDGTVLGLEGLVRWQHPRQGLLTPDRFLPQIKDTPLDNALGEWVINTALAQQRAWHRQGVDLAVSLNISPRQIQDPSFSAFVARALAEHGTDRPVRLEIEILEIAALEDVNAAAEVMRACRELGVRFSLDDFGTGYSSLAYFHQLPIDIVKIDRHFVRNMLDNPEDLAIVEGVVRLAKALQRPVLAEGVESLEIGRMLHQLGCQYAQGFGIARPLPADQVLPWLGDWPHNRPWHNLASDSLETAASLHLLWRPSYDCGEPPIDQEHRELFRLANALLDLAIVDPAPANLIPTLDALVEHVVAHFAHEEAILRQRGYTGLERHSGLHKHLVERALHLRGEVEKGHLSFGQLAEFLSQEVVAQHMLREDRDFFPLFGARRPTQAP